MNALAQDENGVVDFEESADAFAKYMMLKEGNPMFLTTLQSVQLVILVKGIIETPNAKTYSRSSVDSAKDPKKGISLRRLEDIVVIKLIRSRYDKTIFLLKLNLASITDW